MTDVAVSKAIRSEKTALSVTWTTPQSDVHISQYNLQYRIHGTTIWGNQVTISGSSPQNSTFLTRLRAGTEYDIRMRALSAVGAGNWSAVQTERTYTSEFFSMIPQPSGAYMFLDYHNFHLSWFNNYILFCNKLQIHFVHLFNHRGTYITAYYLCFLVACISFLISVLLLSWIRPLRCVNLTSILAA